MISNTSIDEVRQRADIVEVVGNFLTLKRRGVNYLANCPFHNEKTPSFNVNPTRGIYKCFGCGKGGDVFSFVEEYEQFSFVETIRWLAAFYNIALEETEQSDEQKLSQQSQESLRILNEFAANYFQQNLVEGTEGKLIGMSYLKERGFTLDTIQEFGLGYANDAWSDFENAAKRAGFSEELLVASGLLTKRETKQYDSYRGRVIFPIYSNAGKVIAFGARILKTRDKAPKYINSPENELYSKSKSLYGLYQSRTHISKQDQAYLVEGYTDVISLHQGGVKNVVSSSGTSLTEGQLRLLRNLSKNLTILYDGDAAGVNAALRGLDMALSEGFNVTIVQLPEGQDPDSYIQIEGDTLFEKYVADNRRNVIDFRIDLGFEKAKTDAVYKSQLVNELAETISKVDKTEDFVLQQELTHRAAERLLVDEQGLINLVNLKIRERLTQDRKRSNRTDEPTSENLATPTIDSENLLSDAGKYNRAEEEEEVLRVLLKYGEKPYKENQPESVADIFFETYGTESFTEDFNKIMVAEYEMLYDQGKVEDANAHFLNHPNSALRRKAGDFLSSFRQPSNHWEDKFGIKLPNEEDTYTDQAQSAFGYFGVKMVQQSIAENMLTLLHCEDDTERSKIMRDHLELKKMEHDMMQNLVVKR